MPRKFWAAREVREYRISYIEPYQDSLLHGRALTHILLPACSAFILRGYTFDPCRGTTTRISSPVPDLMQEGAESILIGPLQSWWILASHKSEANSPKHPSGNVFWWPQSPT